MNIEQDFLNELENKLWKSADKLRSSIDAANYKYIILGFIFLKYISDAFEARRAQLLEIFQKEGDDNIHSLSRTEYNSDAEYKQAIAEGLECVDYYSAENVLWVPEHARWSYLRSNATCAIGDVLWQDEKGKDVKMRSVSWLVDNAFDEVESSNPKLKNVLNRISEYHLSDDTLIGIIATFSDTSFNKSDHKEQATDLHSKDILGYVYEYFLGQFALTEGQKGGQFYTPKNIVTLVVEMLEPFAGRVYDPAMGAGGFFVSSDKFLRKQAESRGYDFADQRNRISIYGQEKQQTTWNLAIINMVIRGLEFDFGKGSSDTFFDDQHPNLRADYIMANPPFNVSDWWSSKLENDVRWQYGTPPKSNANFGWIQHMLYHLAPEGTMATLLANGSMSSQASGEGNIRKALIESNLIECMVALPGQLFANTQIPACIWILTKDKKGRESNKSTAHNYKRRNRKSETLFIDARNLGFMKTSKMRDFTEEDIAKITNTYHAWKKGKGYENEAGFCFSAKIADIEKNGFILTPGRYVGTAKKKEDGEKFSEKMARITAKLGEQLKEDEKLEQEIRKNLAGLGYKL